MEASVIHLGRMRLNPLDLLIIFILHIIYTLPPSVVAEYHRKMF